MPIYIRSLANDENTPTDICRGEMVHIFVEPSDGHTAFTISLCLDTSFAMVPRALRPDLDRAKSTPSFEAQTGQTLSHAAARRD